MSLVGAVVVEAVWSRWHKQRRRRLFFKKKRSFPVCRPGRGAHRGGGWGFCGLESDVPCVCQRRQSELVSEKEGVIVNNESKRTDKKWVTTAFSGLREGVEDVECRAL